MAPQYLSGHLLLSSPSLFDPNFRRTVVLITEHSEEGAMGLVLNRSADATVAEAVPDLAVYADDDEELLAIGGPVQPSAVIVLAEFEDPEAAAAIVLDDDIGFVPARADDHEEVAAGCRRARVFAGHSGWGPGQLEEELEEKAWIVEAAVREDIFETDPDALWANVMRRKGGQYRLIATMPEDPALN
jgi:putative transcriptional regulator